MLYVWVLASDLSEGEAAAVVFEFVLHRSQLSEFRDIRKRFQPTDGSF